MAFMSTSSIVNSLLSSVDRRPEGWAVRDPHAQLSYAELAAAVEREAAELVAAGLTAGDLVMTVATHSVDYLVTYFAAAHLGCRVLPWDSEAPTPEAEREIARYAVPFVLRPGPEPVSSRLTRTNAEPTHRVADAAVCLPTSGTSGLPKRAEHSPQRLLANARAHAESVHLSESDVCLVSLSPAFGYCHTAQILAVLDAGGRLVFPPRPALPGELGALVERWGVTTTTMVPHQLGEPMLRALGQGGTLRQLVLGGSAVGEQLARRVAQTLPDTELVQTWGMTEAGPRLTTWRSGRDGERLGSVGLALDGVQVVAAGPDGSVPLASVPADLRLAPGELVVRTPYLMRGYLDAPEATAAAIIAPDTLRTGDLGRVDGDGYVYLSGRAKNLIDVSGKKVSPEEIESVLLAMPGVAEVKVFGEPDPRRGQAPSAVVVAEPGAELTQAALRAYACEQLSRHKWPHRFEIVTRIDRTQNGKVRRW